MCVTSVETEQAREGEDKTVTPKLVATQRPPEQDHQWTADNKRECDWSMQAN